MLENDKIWVASSGEEKIYLYPSMANRHGLIAGATGTGKTVTMRVLAESFSAMGVPVFFSDVKGDLSGTCIKGEDTESMAARIQRFGIENWSYTGFPTRFWDIFGENGHKLRVTVSGMGPVLLSRLFGLTEVQAGVLNIVFRVADDHGLLLDDLKDLRQMVKYVGDNKAEFTTAYGNVTPASIGAIQRALLAFEAEGGSEVFGRPELDVNDWMTVDDTGRGYINILSAAKLIQSPTVYATFLLWLLSELYEKLPEVGDCAKPKMIFFFDEAHLLFDGANKALVAKIEQIVKLIRSKGVGVYFITQSPSDIPSAVLAQLSNRVQHALRAYTPDEQKAIKAAARAFRTDSVSETENILKELGVGEALISFLDEGGIPNLVVRGNILPPQSKMGPASPSQVAREINCSEMEEKYRETDDRESAYEILTKAQAEVDQQMAAAAEEAAAEKQRIAEEKALAKQQAAEEKEAAKAAKLAAKEEAAAKKNSVSYKAKSATQKAVTSAASSVSRSISSNIINTLTGGKKVSAGTMAKRAATNALSSLLRGGTSGIIRGLFGNKK